jgi:hypothetical protein
MNQTLKSGLHPQKAYNQDLYLKTPYTSLKSLKTMNTHILGPYTSIYSLVYIVQRKINVTRKTITKKETYPNPHPIILSIL